MQNKYYIEKEIPEGYEARIEGNKVILERKESEDERIRKHIIDIIKDNAKSKSIPCDAEIDYLERQKEREDKLYEKTKDRFYKEGVDDGILIGKKRQKEQKPVEWSEDDENRLNNLFRIIDDSNWNEASKQGFKIFLKSLRPQPHWKPSEQEKGALSTAIYVLTEERNFPKTAAQLQNIINAFEGKESRKDWKPSEEQLKEYSYWYRNFIESGLASPSSKAVTVLGELLEQLEKL